MFVGEVRDFGSMVEESEEEDGESESEGPLPEDLDSV